MVARLQINRHGSNRNRKKLSHIPSLDLTATRVQEPVIHGKGYKARSRVSREKKQKSKARAAAEEGDSVKQMVLDDLDDRAIRKRKHNLDSADRYEA
mmetsp:Transcript_12343/g.15746  ORF Transcript_12343/g.15746 Transcript_12343/m.15746 type:complete len:97 (+) Transcript_12343:718-1008(+)